MALAVIRVDVEDGVARLGRHTRWAMAAVAIGAYLLTARMTSTDQLGHGYYNTLMALGAALFLALVVLFGAPGEHGRLPLVRVLSSRPLVAVGLVSYSLFLWHVPVIFLLEQHGLTFGGNAGFLANVLVVGAISLMLSALTYRFVETPALRYKRSGTPSAARSSAGSGNDPQALDARTVEILPRSQSST